MENLLFDTNLEDIFWNEIALEMFKVRLNKIRVYKS